MRSNFDCMKLFSLCLLLGIFPSLAQAQRSDESVRVKVQKTQEGHTLQIEDDVPVGDAQNLEQLMNKYGMSDELKELKPGEEVEIVIRRKQGGEESNDVTIEMDRKPTTPVTVATPPLRVEPKPAFLGVHYEMNFGSTVGSHITKVEPGTPAYKAGLKEGDVITQADGIQLYELDDLSRIISKKKAGEKVRISYVRDGKPSVTMITLAERDEEFFKNNAPQGHYQMEQEYDLDPGSRIWINDRSSVSDPDASGPLLGVIMLQMENRTLINGTETVTKSDGAIVDEVIGNSAAQAMGLRKGDKILVINGRHIKAAAEVTALVATMKVGDKVDVEYLRDGQRHASTGLLKSRKGFVLPTDEQLRKNSEIYGIGNEEEEPGVFDRVHRMMDEARARANGSDVVVREFRMVIKMDELSPAEAQALSAKTGHAIKSSSDLDLRGLALSPNPSTGKFQMAFDLPAKGTSTIEVMDMNGTVVYTEQLRDFQGHYVKDFDISEEAKGIYVMRIVQNGRSFTRKIVTQ